MMAEVEGSADFGEDPFPEGEEDLSIEDDDDEEEYDDVEDEEDRDELVEPDDAMDDDDDDIVPMALPDRVQRLLKDQLTKELDRIASDNRDKDALLKQLKQEREDYGVQLYASQHELTGLQETLESLHDKYIASVKAREELETNVSESSEANSTRQKEAQEQDEKLTRFQAELDRMSETLVQVERYNEEIHSKIAIKRRETYKAEKDVSDLEKEKKSQDILLDSLNDRIKRQREQLALYKEQTSTQNEESKAARETLNEASKEMAAIEFDKKQLLQQWRGSLVGMQRRDEALKATEDAIRKQHEQLTTLETEMKAYKVRIKESQRRNEQLTSVKNKLKSEAEYLEKQLEELQERDDALIEQNGRLSQSLEMTDTAIEGIKAEEKKLRTAIAAVEKQIDKETQRTKEAKDAITVVWNSRRTIQKGSESTVRMYEQVTNEIEEKELEIAHVKNDISRTRMEVLSAEEEKNTLEYDLDDAEQDVRKRVAIVEKYEMENRRKNDEIERKQRDLDKLNRKLEQIMAAREGQEAEEDLGPLEAKIRELNRAIEIAEQESEDLQRRWTKQQTALVTLVQTQEEKSDVINELESQIVVLKQKQGRLDEEYREHTGELKTLSRNMDKLRLDMKRMNTFLSENERTQESLAEVNFDLENEISHKLRCSEKEVAHLITNIEEAQRQKRESIAQLVECERQIMMWEKKIQLSKETAAAIDPEVGKEDITNMKREIHIMKMRLAQLQREQRQMIEDMERMISKRQSIAQKGRAATAKKKAGVSTRATVKSEMTLTSRELEKEKKVSAELEQEVKRLYRQQRELGDRLEETNVELEGQRETLRQRDDDVKKLGLLKYSIVTKKSEQLRNIQRYTEIKEGKFKPSVSLESADEELMKVEEERVQLERLQDGLREELPDLVPQLDKITASMK